MSFNIQKINDNRVAAEVLADKILEQLAADKKVLWFVTGGSSIAVAVEASKKIRDYSHENLTVMLTDERYGAIDHPDSNWLKLEQEGFSLPEAKSLPVLMGNDRSETTRKLNDSLKEEFTKSEYKIGLFGIGTDGHTAGILPHSKAIESLALAYDYDSDKFERITITPKAILELDEAIVFMEGKEKAEVIEDLKISIPLNKMPAQILKKVPLLTIFYKYE